jgi:hypothetical protein
LTGKMIEESSLNEFGRHAAGDGDGENDEAADWPDAPIVRRLPQREARLLGDQLRQEAVLGVIEQRADADLDGFRRMGLGDGFDVATGTGVPTR